MHAPARQLAYDRRALLYLRGLTKKLARQIIRKIEALPANPMPSGYKPVEGEAFGGRQVYRIRSGDYRILYVFDASELLITNIDNRKDVYR